MANQFISSAKSNSIRQAYEVMIKCVSDYKKVEAVKDAVNVGT